MKLKEFFNLGIKKTYDRKSILYQEGDDSDCIYFIKKGSVKVFIINTNSEKECVISFLREGEWFGEIEFLDKNPRITDVVTMEKCELICLRRSQITEIPLEIYSGVIEKARLYLDIIRSLTTMSSYERVRQFLLKYTGQDGIVRKHTQSDIAKMVGCSRENVSIIFRELKTGGYITCKKSIINILKPLPENW
jgi:CRP-like cAMP-binding protein